MTLHEQRTWLRREHARCEHLLAAPYVIGGSILDKARADLAAIVALLATVQAMDAPLLQTPRRTP